MDTVPHNFGGFAIGFQRINSWIDCLKAGGIGKTTPKLQSSWKALYHTLQQHDTMCDISGLDFIPMYKHLSALSGGKTQGGGCQSPAGALNA